MTREELKNSTIWTTGKLQVFSKFFNKEVKIQLDDSEYDPEDAKKGVSGKTIDTIMEFLNLSETHKPLMQELLYKHCKMCCEAASYGFEVQDGEDETEVNMREFGVTNKKDALENAKLYNIIIDEAKSLKNRYATIVFYPEWEMEHGCEIIVKNGELLDFYGEGGTDLWQFE